MFGRRSTRSAEPPPRPPAGPFARPPLAERVLDSVMTVPRLLIGVLILVNIAINFSNVVRRYIVFSPIIWAEEIMMYIMVWSVFLGAALISWEGSHLRMDILSQLLPQRLQRVLNALVALFTIAIGVFVVSQSWQLISMLAAFGQRSVIAEVPMVIPHSAVALGFGLIVVAVLVRFRTEVIGASATAPGRDEAERGGATP